MLTEDEKEKFAVVDEVAIPTGLVKIFLNLDVVSTDTIIISSTMVSFSIGPPFIF